MRTIILSVLLISVATSAQSQERIKFASLNDKMQVYGDLYLPERRQGKVPAMVIVHGTSGVDSRTKYFAEELPKHGIAAFVVDFKTGVFTTPSNRPKNDEFQPSAYAALRVLRSRSDINPARIGIMGFSLGGHLSLTTALTENKSRWLGDETNFSVHVSYYPGCKYFIPKLISTSKIDAPLMVFWGTNDSYGDGESCPKLKEALTLLSQREVELVSFENAHHGFDGDRNTTYNDPAANYGRGESQSNPTYGSQARQQTVNFLKKNLHNDIK